MSEIRNVTDEFGLLLDVACKGELTPEQQLDLERYLEKSPAAQRIFLDHISLCAGQHSVEGPTVLQKRLGRGAGRNQRERRRSGRSAGVDRTTERQVMNTE